MPLPPLKEIAANAAPGDAPQGLIDPQQNIRALQMTGGNVEAAIELIFSGRQWRLLRCAPVLRC